MELASRRAPCRHPRHARRWCRHRRHAVVPRREPGDRTEWATGRPPRARRRGAPGPRAPCQPDTGPARTGGRRPRRTTGHPERHRPQGRPPRGAERDPRRRPRTRPARPVGTAGPALPGAVRDRHGGPGVGTRRRCRVRRGHVRLGRPGPARPRPLLRDSRADAAARVRQHPEWRQPHPLGLARPDERLGARTSWRLITALHAAHERIRAVTRPPRRPSAPCPWASRAPS